MAAWREVDAAVDTHRPGSSCSGRSRCCESCSAVNRADGYTDAIHGLTALGTATAPKRSPSQLWESPGQGHLLFEN